MAAELLLFTFEDCTGDPNESAQFLDVNQARNYARLRGSGDSR